MMFANREGFPTPNSSSWHFLVSETTRHVRGHTVYKVTLQIIPVDVSQSIEEVIYWKRYSDFRQIHKNLAALHSALYLKGAFPPFPKPTVFHRHEEGVIEERRRNAEKLLNFITTFPILCRQDVFKEFLKGGEKVCHSSGCGSDSTQPLEPKRLYLAEETVKFTQEERNCDSGSLSPDRFSPVAGIWQHRQADDEDDAVQSPVCDGDDLSSPDSCENALTDAMVLPENIKKYLNGIPAFSDSRSAKANNSGNGASDDQDYLFIAEDHLIRAADKERVGDFEDAFGLYKLGIDVLLQGVQTDTDSVRREAVRRKAAQYLSKAEQLYSQYINVTDDDSQNLDNLVHCDYASVAGNHKELADYAVIGVLTVAVVLVRHRSTQEVLVLKTLTKTPWSKRRDSRTIVPLKPHKYMVNLRRLIETEEAVHLLLEYISSKKLSEYLQREQQDQPTAVSNIPAVSAYDSKRRPSTNSTHDYNVSWNKLADSIGLNIDPEPPVDSSPRQSRGAGDYGDLFLKYARSNSEHLEVSSLAHVDDTTDPTVQCQVSPDSADDEGFSLSELLELADNSNGTSSDQTSLHPEADFLRSMEPLATPTMRGLAHWREVSEIDSNQLVAKSKELMQSVDCTIRDSLMKKQAVPAVEKMAAREVLESDKSNAKDIKPLIAGQLPSGLCPMTENVMRIWLAEIVLAVEALHEIGLICVDLSPDSIFVDDKGHIKLVYFVQWNSVLRDFDSEIDADACFIAPELRKVGTKFDPICDSWSIGVIFLSLLSFQRFNELKSRAPHSHRKVEIPSGLSPETQDVLSKLLKFNPRERMTLSEMKQHPFFRSLDWKHIPSDDVHCDPSNNTNFCN